MKYAWVIAVLKKELVRILKWMVKLMVQYLNKVRV